MKQVLLSKMSAAIVALIITMLALPSGARAQSSGYDVVLEAFGDQKIPVIKAVKEITGLGLKDAKELVDNCPSIIKESIPKADADAAVEKLRTAGATANAYSHGSWSRPFVTIDGAKKVILSTGYEDKGDDNFSLHLYLSENKEEHIEIQGNKKRHVGKDIDLTKKESEHDEWYWAIAYLKDNKTRLFNAFAQPNNSSVVFTTGTLRIDGDPGDSFTLRLTNGKITDNEHGDGKTHTIAIDCSKITVIEYALFIAGEAVTLDNCSDLSVIDGVSGRVRYDPESKTLTLQDATIRTSEEGDGNGSGTGIYNKIDGLTIKLIGKNSITSDKGIGIWNEENLTLMGNGSLKVVGSTTAEIENNRRGILNKGTITVKDCTVEASGGKTGLAAGYWTFDHCSVRTKGGGSADDEYAGSLSWMWDKKPEFIGCSITEPEGADWKEFTKDGYSYYSLFGRDGKVVTDWVTISTGGTGVEAVIADDSAHEQTIYNLQGVRMTEDFDLLPSGIYIVNGKKMIKE